MQQIAVKTTQNVFVNLRPAGVGRRIGAFFIDLLCIGSYSYLILELFLRIFDGFNIFNTNRDELGFINALYTLAMLPAFTYSLWTEFLFNGQTIGKMALQIRVVKLNGFRAGFYEFFTRWLFRMVDIWVFMFATIFLHPIFSNQDVIAGISVLLFYLSGSVAVFTILRTKNDQRIGDLVAGTTVTKIKEKESINITILKELKQDYTPVYPQVIKLSDNDARIIKDTFENARRIRDYKTLHKLRLKLEEVMDVKAKENDATFIDIVMKDFNYYTQKI